MGLSRAPAPLEGEVLRFPPRRRAALPRPRSDGVGSQRYRFASVTGNSSAGSIAGAGAGVVRCCRCLLPVLWVVFLARKATHHQ